MRSSEVDGCIGCVGDSTIAESGGTIPACISPAGGISIVLVSAGGEYVAPVAVCACPPCGCVPGWLIHCRTETVWLEKKLY